MKTITSRRLPIFSIILWFVAWLLLGNIVTHWPSTIDANRTWILTQVVSLIIGSLAGLLLLAGMAIRKTGLFLE